MASKVASDAVLGKLGLDARRFQCPLAGFPMWLIDSEKFGPQALENLLSQEERTAADRFRRPELRNRYIAAHGGLRILLRDRYGIPLAAQAMDRNGFGKPHLTRYPQLHFSISYSGQHILMGVSEGEPIGVDIEVLRTIEDAAELMDMHFTEAEQAEVRSRGALGKCVSRAFLETWVRKEACLKAYGSGLNIPLNSVECPLGNQMTTVQLSDSQFRTGALQNLGDPIMAWSLRICV